MLTTLSTSLIWLQLSFLLKTVVNIQLLAVSYQQQDSVFQAIHYQVLF
ncbi:hypothetical protein [Okeania sp.]|nr:hypothetical protein [Okeania sp.]